MSMPPELSVHIGAHASRPTPAAKQLIDASLPLSWGSLQDMLKLLAAFSCLEETTSRTCLADVLDMAGYLQDAWQGL